MANPLFNIYNSKYTGVSPGLNVYDSPVGTGNFNPQSGAYSPQTNNLNPQTDTNTQTLPYGGGTYNPGVAGGAIFPTTPPAPAPPENDLYAKYRDPKTGEIMSPEEYAISLGNKVPKGTGQIPNYAGDALTNPNQTTNELIGRATGLNNARNDIATGTTDPYGVGNKSGIAYSPQELKAIESAYAGVYDPALNDVFSRLRDKESEDKAIADRENIVFKTNEAIRQWQSTTGTKSSGVGDGTESGNYKFTNSQLNSGASNAGLGIDAFNSLHPELKNFYINPPKAKGSGGTQVPIYQNFEEDILAIANGELDRQVLVDDITNSTKLSPEVKTYFLGRIPEATEEEMDGWWANVWNALRGN